MKTEFCSDNSVSLPGITGSSGPVGFEPGMFKNEDENSSCSHTKSKSDKDKSIDGQSKVSVHFLRNSELHLTCLTPFYFRKRRRKTKNATSTRSIVIIKTRRSAKRVANVKRAENVRRARRRKIRTYHVCRWKRKHRKHWAQPNNPAATAIKRSKIWLRLCKCLRCKLICICIYPYCQLRTI